MARTVEQRRGDADFARSLVAKMIGAVREGRRRRLPELDLAYLEGAAHGARAVTELILARIHFDETGVPMAPFVDLAGREPRRPPLGKDDPTPARRDPMPDEAYPSALLVFDDKTDPG